MRYSLFIRLALALAVLLSLGLAPAAAQDCEGEIIELDFMNWWGAAREALMDELIGHFRLKIPASASTIKFSPGATAVNFWQPPPPAATRPASL